MNPSESAGLLSKVSGISTQSGSNCAPKLQEVQSGLVKGFLLRLIPYLLAGHTYGSAISIGGGSTSEARRVFWHHGFSMSRCTHTAERMGACEHGDELQKRLRAAFEEWYGSSTFRAKVVKRKPPRRKFTIFSVRQATTLRSMGAIRIRRGPFPCVFPATKGIVTQLTHSRRMRTLKPDQTQDLQFFELLCV